MSFSMRTPKLLLAISSLALIVLVLLSSVEETRANVSPHHRHRHRHELQRLPSRKRDDYEEDYYSDSSNSDEDYQDDDFYSDESESEEKRPSRSHRNSHSSRHEPRYAISSRYHRRRHHTSARHSNHPHHRSRAPVVHHRRRYDDEDSSLDDYDDDEDVLDNETYNSRFGGKHKRKRTGHRSTRHESRKDSWRYRNNDEDDYDDDYDLENYDDGYESDREDDDENHGKKHDRFRKHDSNRRYSSEWIKKIRHLSNGSRVSHQEPSRKRANTQDDEDAFEQLWKDDDDENETDELDNDFYGKDDSSAPLKTYDDIIRRLTEDRATTSTSTSTLKPTKRNYRNTELESHLRRDAYGNLRFIDSSHRNVSYRANIVLDHDDKGAKDSDYDTNTVSLFFFK